MFYFGMSLCIWFKHILFISYFAFSVDIQAYNSTSSGIRTEAKAL